ncbi:hypothetical protein V0R50_21815, partial [Pseudomonas sp. 148P]
MEKPLVGNKILACGSRIVGGPGMVSTLLFRFEVLVLVLRAYPLPAAALPAPSAFTAGHFCWAAKVTKNACSCIRPYAALR